MEQISNIGPCVKGPEPKYKVIKVYRDSARRQVIEKNLSRDEAIRLVNTFPDRKRSMVIFMQQ